MDRKRKLELRIQNEKAWNGSKDLLPLNSSLDSSLKKNTSFIKRLRTTISPSTQNAFLQEICALSLSRYLSEIISACYEGLCKLKAPGDVDAGVEIVSALHQRFGPEDFTEHLGWLLGKGMATPDRSFLKTLSPEARDKEEKDRLTRQRSLLRVITELWLVGVLKTLDEAVKPDDATRSVTNKSAELKARCKAGPAEPFPLEVIKDLLGHDREHVNLSLLVVFLKAFSWDILGVDLSGTDGRKTVGEDGTIAGEQQRSSDGNESDSNAPQTPAEPLVSPDTRDSFRHIFVKYFEDVKGHVVRDQKSIQSQARRNAEAYVKSGEVFEDRQTSFDRLVKAQERLVANAQVLADAIGALMPDLKGPDENSAASNNSVGLLKTGEYLKAISDGAGIWADEEERRFYENLVDLKGKVPPILLDDNRKKKPEGEEIGGKKVDKDSVDESKTSEAADDRSTIIANKTIGAQVDALLARLPDLTREDVVDQIAVDFCYLNSKASRNRLIKALTEVPKGRSDLYATWSRLVATLGRYMPDVPKGLVDYLDAEFRSLQRRKEKDFLGQVRLGNVRYLAELTKFGVVPEHVIFHCLKVSLDDFSRMNIEILCNLIENCGRYLLRNPDTSPRMASFLETLQRKKSVQHIGHAERMLIDNATYYVDPPERPAIQQKERTPMDLFVRKLVYVDMTRRNYGKILKQIRRLHWEEPEVVALLEKTFSKPSRMKYGNIHILGILLSALYRYHPDFVVKVIDNVVESVSLGLEQNDFRFLQQRISEVKYLGELYNYRMLEHPVIFDIMYRIVTFGHGGPPVPGRYCPLDPPDDFFRIRLISTMLETCGVFFNRGAAGKKLDYFLSFFQYYIHTKASLPLDIEFAVQDTFNLTRPQWQLATNLEEAAKAFQLAVAQDQKSTADDRQAEVDDAASSSSTDDENAEDDELENDDVGDDESVSGDEDPDIDEHSGDEGPYDEDEALVVTRQEEAVDPEDEADFEREYARMMADSLESRKFERKQLFDVPLPVRVRNRDTVTGGDDDESGPSSKSDQKMTFALLTKKGTRQQTRTVELPSDSTFAVAMKHQQMAEKQEQQRIKNLVLNYDLQQADELEENERPAAFHHNRVDRSGKDRGQRVRKLQLSDVDW